MRNLPLLELFLNQLRSLFSFAAFKTFLLIFSSQKFNSVFFICGFFEFILLVCFQLLKSVDLPNPCPLPNLGSFWSLFLGTLSPSFRNSNDMHVKSFVTVPLVPEALF